MNFLKNVKFNTIKNDMIREILQNIEESLILHKHLFLTERKRFNGFFVLNTVFTFINEDYKELNRFEQIIYKPLTIEDFLYRSLEEMLFEYKTHLTVKLNEMEKEYYINFFNLTIYYGSFANFNMNSSYNHIE